MMPFSPRCLTLMFITELLKETASVRYHVGSLTACCEPTAAHDMLYNSLPAMMDIYIIENIAS